MSDQESKEGVSCLSKKMQMCSTSDADINTQKVINTRSSFEVKKNFETRNKMHSNYLKAVNLPERIIFIIDATTEPNSSQFEIGKGDKFSPLFMIKRVIEIFINIKSRINHKHEYALMILRGNEVKYIQTFTSNISDFLIQLDEIDEVQSNNTYFDLGKLFSSIEEIVIKREMNSVTRAILIYCRSVAIPKFSSPRITFDNLMKKHRFFLDIFYIHENPSDDNECDAVYSELNALDVKNCAYIFEVGRNATRLHENMVKLVAHPLQRPVQRNAIYSLQLHLNSLQKEGHTNV